MDASPAAAEPGSTAPPAPSPRGFTLVECLVVCALVGLAVACLVPAARTHELRVGRLDAVQALTRVQVAQENYRAAHGLYTTEWNALQGAGPVLSAQGRYQLSLQLQGSESYTAVATATGVQTQDHACNALTLQVARGFAQHGPSADCWNR
jgi:type IV pilus assembly protein PilE